MNDEDAIFIEFVQQEANRMADSGIAFLREKKPEFVPLAQHAKGAFVFVGDASGLKTAIMSGINASATVEAGALIELVKRAQKELGYRLVLSLNHRQDPKNDTIPAGLVL